MMMSTDCLFTVMAYKISEKSSAIQVTQEMSSVCYAGCIVSAADADGVSEEFRC